MNQQDVEMALLRNSGEAEKPIISKSNLYVILFYAAQIIPAMIMWAIFVTCIIPELMYNQRYQETTCYLNYTTLDNEYAVIDDPQTCYYNMVDTLQGVNMIPWSGGMSTFICATMFALVAAAITGSIHLVSAHKIPHIWTCCAYGVVTLLLNLIMFLCEPSVQWEGYLYLFLALYGLKNVLVPYYIFEKYTVNTAAIKYLLVTTICSGYVLLNVYCLYYTTIADPFNPQTIMVSVAISEIVFVILFFYRL
jgi:hypothetical protein